MATRKFFGIWAVATIGGLFLCAAEPVKAGSLFGACCDPTTGVCEDNVDVTVCVAPKVFSENEVCSDISCDPPVCVQAPSGMVSWWPGDGNADDIQDGNNGTLNGGATFAAGKVGPAFSLDGVDDFIEIADSANLNPAQMTVDAWVKLDTINEGSRIVSKDISLATCVDPFVVYSLEVRGLSDFGGPANSAAFFFTTADLGECPACRARNISVCHWDIYPYCRNL